MRHIVLIALAALSFGAGCDRGANPEVERAAQAMDVIDEANLGGIMLAAGDPAEAVAYFRRASTEKPGRIDLRRGLATSLVRAKRGEEAAAAWAAVTAMPGATDGDRVEQADALIRAGRWAEAEAVLDSVPPSHTSARRYRLEAMIADGNGEWAKADSFYETAASLDPAPAGILNNWGYSRLSRGDHPGAERLFSEALAHEPGLFTAKNNLVLARAAQRKYDLPVVAMTQTERAELLHTAALAAVKQGDVATAKALLQEAVETHPQHFEAAARALAALGAV